MENFGMSKVAARVKKEQKRKSEGKDHNGGMIIEELNEVLKHAKKRKSCGLDNLPMKLWKFGGNELKIQLL